MAISFKPLWHLLIEKGLKKYELTNIAGLSPCIIANMSKNKSINLSTLNKLCTVFDCQPNDIIKYVPDKKIETKS